MIAFLIMQIKMEKLALAEVPVKYRVAVIAALGDDNNG